MSVFWPATRAAELRQQLTLPAAERSLWCQPGLVSLSHLKVHVSESHPSWSRVSLPLEGITGKGRICEMERPGFVLLPSPYPEFWVDGPRNQAESKCFGVSGWEGTDN